MPKLPVSPDIHVAEIVSYPVHQVLHPVTHQGPPVIAKDSFKYDKKDRTLPQHAKRSLQDTGAWLGFSGMGILAGYVAPLMGAAGIVGTALGGPVAKSATKLIRRPLIKHNKGFYKLRPGEKGRIFKYYRKDKSAYASIVKDIHTIQQRQDTGTKKSLPYKVSSFAQLKDRGGKRKKPVKVSILKLDLDKTLEEDLRKSTEDCQKFYGKQRYLKTRLLEKHPEYLEILEANPFKPSDVAFKSDSKSLHKEC